MRVLKYSDLKHLHYGGQHKRANLAALLFNTDIYLMSFLIRFFALRGSSVGRVADCSCEVGGSLPTADWGKKTTGCY